MGEYDGKVALVTGAGRGQGRACAVRFAEQGADVVVLDLGGDGSESATAGYPMATAADLDETVRLVEQQGRRALRAVADVRRLEQVQAVVDDALAAFGRIDVVHANAGIGVFVPITRMTAAQWQETVDVNLTGVFNTVRATVDQMIERAQGGVYALTSSTAGLLGYLNATHYAAAKHGVIGMVKVLAQELGPHGIRVNAICPTTVDTPMIANDATFRMFAPHLADPGPDDVREAFAGLNALADVPWIGADDVADAVAWICSDAARYVTGVALPVDAGNLVRKGW